MWDNISNNGFTSCNLLSNCRSIYNIYQQKNYKILNNKNINLYIGGLDTFEVSNNFINDKKILTTFYSTSLKLAKFQLNSYNLFDFNNNYEKKILLNNRYLHNSDKCSEIYCGEYIWSTNCNFAKGELKLNSFAVNTSEPFLTLDMLEHYEKFLSIEQDFQREKSYSFNFYLEFQFNKFQYSTILLRTSNTIIAVSVKL